MASQSLASAQMYIDAAAVLRSSASREAANLAPVAVFCERYVTLEWPSVQRYVRTAGSSGPPLVESDRAHESAGSRDVRL